MTVDFEGQVREVIGERLDRVVAPTADPAALLRRARRRTARRTVSGVAAGAVAVLGVVTIVNLGTSQHGAHRGEHSSGVPITTAGARGPAAVDAPTAVFHTKKNVWIDGNSYPAGNFTWSTGAHIGARGIAYPDKKTGRPYLMRRNGEQVPLAPVHPAFGKDYAPWIAADASSPLVAWVERGATEVELVAFDTRSMTEVARKRVACTGDPQTWGYACVMPYVADSGVVFVHDEGNTVGWQPATDRWDVLGRGLASQARGRVLGLFPGEDNVDVGALGDDWRVLHVSGPYWTEREKHGDIEPLLSFDGSWVTDANGTRVENWAAPEQTIRFDPPGKIQASQYDTDGSVLYVTSSHGSYRVWDCTPTARCAPASSPMRQEIRLIAWDS
jgi:hypothetical protein